MAGLLDIPKFRTSPIAIRYLISKVILLVFLGALLYLGIYVNYYLVLKTIPEFVNWLFIIGIVILLVLQILLSYVKYGQYYYTFFDNHLAMSENRKISIDYDLVSDIRLKENIIDRWFKTSTILMTIEDGSRKRMVKICNVPKGNQIFFFLQKKINVHK